MDSVGNGLDAESGGWTFGGKTPEAFDVHVNQSIPWYEACHELVVDVADHLVPPGGRCYELGCSTGTLTAKLGARLQAREAELIGVDYEPGMVELARESCAALPLVRFEVSRLEELELETADLVVSYYTLQFVGLRERAAAVERIHRALQPAGALILFEKIIADSARDQEIATGVLYDWKRRQGLTDTEIAAKARSLRGVLTPQSAAENRSMLMRAGFSEPVQLFRWMAWEGVVARATAV